MPPPKDPIKYARYIKRQSESHMGQVSSRKGKRHRPGSIELMREAHKGQTSGFKGKKHKQESIDQYKEKRKTWVVRPKGSHLTEEHIENNRKAHLGQIPWMKGKKHKPETIEINRQKHLGKPSPRKGAVLSEHTKNLVRKARSRQVFPLKDTKPERIAQIALALNGIKFDKHKLIQTKTFFHQVDLFIEPNICIEIDGDYWHKLPTVVERDKEINENLIKLGYKIIRIWASDIKKDAQNCILKLK